MTDSQGLDEWVGALGIFDIVAAAAVVSPMLGGVDHVSRFEVGGVLGRSFVFVTKEDGFLQRWGFSHFLLR